MGPAKLDKANQLGISILSEIEFVSLLEWLSAAIIIRYPTIDS
jgi:BRCT domain type II-containing protein